MNAIEEKVTDALSNGTSHEYFDEYAKSLLENIRNVNNKLHHSALFLLLFTVIFELLTRAAISEVSIGPFKVSDLSLIHKFIPVLIAYFYLLFVSQALLQRFITTAYWMVTKKIHEPVFNNNLERFQFPPSLLLISVMVEEYSKARVAKLLSFLIKLGVAVVCFGTLIFEVYAYYRCFVVFGYNDIGVWISLIISVIFILATMLALQYLATAKELE